MKLSEYLDTALLQQHIANGYVDQTNHKKFPLVLFTYSRKAMQEDAWDAVTEKCRGLIVNFLTDEIVARPYEKFFNLGTHSRPETHFTGLPDTEPDVFEKLDGSLGIGYTYAGVCYIASKGSFHSIHAEWATKWYHDNVPNPSWPPDATPVFEMVCESVQHHVVHYGADRLVLTAIINNRTGEEFPYNELELAGIINGIEVVRKCGHHNWKRVLAEDVKNEEGYVLSWPRPGQTPLKVKVKFPTFLRLQRLMHNVGPKQVFEYLSSRYEGAERKCPNCNGTGSCDTGGTLPWGESVFAKCSCTERLEDWLEYGTPEFADFIRGWVHRLEAEYQSIFKTSAAIVTMALQTCTTRKEFAEFFLKQGHKECAAVCFAILDEKDYKRAIWKLVEPLVKGTSPMSSYDIDAE